MKILTVSIAAYNVDKYLRTTLDSLKDGRLLNDLEVLIVDDGSKDDTAKIAMQYENEFPDTFHYIKKENGGHGSTINKGIDLATGKYFRVLDGDDSVETDNLVMLVDRLKQYDEDMFIADYRCITSQGEKYEDPSVIMNGKSIFKDMIDDNIYHLSDANLTAEMIKIHTIIIKTSLLKALSFRITEHCFYVDTEFDLWCMAAADHFRFFSKPIYLYLKDRGDGGNSVNKKNMIKNIAMQETVSHQLISIFNQMKTKNMVKGKQNIMLGIITAVVGATIRTYLLMDNSSKRIKDFDASIREQSIDVYNELGNNRFFFYIRFINYSLIFLIRISYRILVQYKY